MSVSSPESGPPSQEPDAEGRRRRASGSAGAALDVPPQAQTPRRMSLDKPPTLNRMMTKRKSEAVCMNVEVLCPEELGIGFTTRARSREDESRWSKLRSIINVGKSHGGNDRQTVELTRMFPQDEKVAANNSLRRRRTMDGTNERMWFFKKYWIRPVPFSSHTWMAHRITHVLKASALTSCMFVLWMLSVEPICVPSSAGSPLERLIKPRWVLQVLLMLCHLITSVMYAVLSTCSRLLFGKIDTIRGEEIACLADVLEYHVWSIGFWMDNIAVIGLFAEMIHLGQAVSPDKTPSVVQWLMLLQLLKIWRWIVPESNSDSGSTFLEGVLSLFFSLAIFAHVMACVLLLLGNMERSWGQSSWTEQHEDADCAELYTEAFYFAVISLTSVGYGDALVTTLERAINSVFLLFAQLFTTKICADLTWLTSTHNHLQAQYQAQRAQTRACLENMQVPSRLAQRVLAFQSYVACVHREDLSHPLFQGLSTNLMQELRLCAYRQLVLQAVFLREQSKEVISLVVGALEDEVYLPADFILRNGAKGRELYFVRRGRAAVFIGGEPPIWGQSQQVATYTPGSYFGELAMLTGKPRAAWVMAASYCVCSVMLYQTVEKLAKEFPSAFTMLVQSMVQAYNLQASSCWQDVLQRMQEKFAFESAVDAFRWLCAQDGGDDEDTLSARAFEESMRRLKVPPLDRKIFWAEMDVDRAGVIEFEEFLNFTPESTFDLSHDRHLGSRRKSAAVARPALFGPSHSVPETGACESPRTSRPPDHIKRESSVDSLPAGLTPGGQLSPKAEVSRVWFTGGFSEPEISVAELRMLDGPGMETLRNRLSVLEKHSEGIVQAVASIRGCLAANGEAGDDDDVDVDEKIGALMEDALTVGTSP